MGKPESKRNWLSQFLLDPFIIRMAALAVFFFVLVPACQAFSNEHGEHVALSAETTYWLFQNEEFGPRNVLISQQLHTMATEDNLADFDQKSIIAAAAIETPRERGMTYWDWLEKMYSLAADLLGLAEIESSYCNNIGSAIALEELEKRLEKAKEENPDEVPWWEANIAALKSLAFRLLIPVNRIPGSEGAGAISCFQLMPVNWNNYGGGHYRDTYQAARNAARFLKAHGYEEDREEAILSYNRNAGQPYVDSVLTAAAKWQEPVKTSLVLVPVELNVITLFMEFSEILAWYMNEQGVFIGIVGDISNPYPGSFICGNAYGQVISATYTHHGVDRCIVSDGEYIVGPVYAAHDGRVTLSRLVDNSDPIAFREDNPGYISASGYVVKLEAQLPDGGVLETIYGHLNPSTIPPVGATVKAGDYLATTECQFNPEIEYCTVHHLHWGAKKDGKMFNPEDLLGK